MISAKEEAILFTLNEMAQRVSQRSLAQRTGFSVGLVNAVLRKLIHTGYVKMVGLNRRSMQYLLTPQGMAEKTKRSYHYMIRTVSHYHTIQGKMALLLQDLQKEGFCQIHLQGNGELRVLLEEVLALQFPNVKLVEHRTEGLPEEAVVNLEATCSKKQEKIFYLLDYL